MSFKITLEIDGDELAISKDSYTEKLGVERGVS